jgi:TPR repeat protein
MPSSQPAGAGSGDLSISHRLSEDEIAMLVSRGNSFIQSGDLVSARLLLKRAAEGGSADAALRLGETFDPKFLNSLGALGISPDSAMARQWYEKAAALGSAGAAQRLAHLNK